jgi:segregation and condensation protein B
MQQSGIAGDGMSLKAKLEAVIYAAEEPITLAQLAALFADEALQWKAEQAAAAAVMAAASLPAAAIDSPAVPMLSEAFAYLELEQMAQAEASTEPVAAEVADEGTEAENAAEAGEVASEATGELSAADEATDAKKRAKLRERDARAAIKQILSELVEDYATDARGIEIREIAGGYRMATKPEFHDAVRSFVKSLKPPLKLSLPALETLAVIAYKQPVTAPEVNDIRGVDSSGVFGSLLARKLIATAGRKPVVGRPILYKTTREFLLRFGLKDVSELPSMEEFEKMAASELEEPETVQEEAPANGEGSEQDAEEGAEVADLEAAPPEAEDPPHEAQGSAAVDDQGTGHHDAAEPSGAE